MFQQYDTWIQSPPFCTHGNSKYISFDGNHCLLIQISLRFMEAQWIMNKSALVQIMLWCQSSANLGILIVYLLFIFAAERQLAEVSCHICLIFCNYTWNNVSDIIIHITNLKFYLLIGQRNFIDTMTNFEVCAVAVDGQWSRLIDNDTRARSIWVRHARNLTSNL